MCQPHEQAAYMAQLNPLEQKVLQIAASHLETSFSLVKSIGFLEWQAQAQAQQAQAQAHQAQAQAQQAQAQAQPAQAQQAEAQQGPVEHAEESSQPKKLTIKIKKKLTPRLV
jgi:hypothetical protein